MAGEDIVTQLWSAYRRTLGQGTVAYAKEAERLLDNSAATKAAAHEWLSENPEPPAYLRTVANTLRAKYELDMSAQDAARYGSLVSQFDVDIKVNPNSGSVDSPILRLLMSLEQYPTVWERIANEAIANNDVRQKISQASGTIGFLPPMTKSLVNTIGPTSPVNAAQDGVDGAIDALSETYGRSIRLSDAYIGQLRDTYTVAAISGNDTAREAATSLRKMASDSRGWARHIRREIAVITDTAEDRALVADVTGEKVNPPPAASSLPPHVREQLLRELVELKDRKDQGQTGVQAFRDLAVFFERTAKALDDAVGAYEMNRLSSDEEAEVLRNRAASPETALERYVPIDTAMQGRAKTGEMSVEQGIVVLRAEYEAEYSLLEVYVAKVNMFLKRHDVMSSEDVERLKRAKALAEERMAWISNDLLPNLNVGLVQRAREQHKDYIAIPSPDGEMVPVRIGVTIPGGSLADTVFDQTLQQVVEATTKLDEDVATWVAEFKSSLTTLRLLIAQHRAGTIALNDFREAIDNLRKRIGAAQALYADHSAMIAAVEGPGRYLLGDTSGVEVRNLLQGMPGDKMSLLELLATAEHESLKAYRQIAGTDFGNMGDQVLPFGAFAAVSRDVVADSRERLAVHLGFAPPDQFLAKKGLTRTEYVRMLEALNSTHGDFRGLVLWSEEHLQNGVDITITGDDGQPKEVKNVTYDDVINHLPPLSVVGLLSTRIVSDVSVVPDRENQGRAQKVPPIAAPWGVAEGGAHVMSYSAVEQAVRRGSFINGYIYHESRNRLINNTFSLTDIERLQRSGWSDPNRVAATLQVPYGKENGEETVPPPSNEDSAEEAPRHAAPPPVPRESPDTSGLTPEQRADRNAQAAMRFAAQNKDAARGQYGFRIPYATKGYEKDGEPDFDQDPFDFNRLYKGVLPDRTELQEYLQNDADAAAVASQLVSVYNDGFVAPAEPVAFHDTDTMCLAVPVYMVDPDGRVHYRMMYINCRMAGMQEFELDDATKATPEQSALARRRAASAQKLLDDEHWVNYAVVVTPPQAVGAAAMVGKDIGHLPPYEPVVEANEGGARDLYNRYIVDLWGERPSAPNEWRRVLQMVEKYTEEEARKAWEATGRDGAPMVNRRELASYLYRARGGTFTVESINRYLTTDQKPNETLRDEQGNWLPPVERYGHGVQDLSPGLQRDVESLFSGVDYGPLVQGSRARITPPGGDPQPAFEPLHDPVGEGYGPTFFDMDAKKGDLGTSVLPPKYSKGSGYVTEKAKPYTTEGKKKQRPQTTVFSEPFEPVGAMQLLVPRSSRQESGE